MDLRRPPLRPSALLLCAVAAFPRLAFALGTNEETAPQFEGNEHYDRAGLEEVLDLKREVDRSAGHLVQKLRAFYVERGFLDAEVAVESRPLGPGHGTVLVFHITEHPRVTVAERSYPCLKTDEIAHLSDGGPRSSNAIGREIDAVLEEELPGADVVQVPDPQSLDALIASRSALAGRRAAPVALDPDATFTPAAYEHALAHVQELYRNEGYLHAVVGPSFVRRRACDRASPRGTCVPVRVARPLTVCAYDQAGLPLPDVPIAEDSNPSCVPNAKTSVECERSIAVEIPVRLGPRTFLYDLTFAGVTSFPEARLALESRLSLGDPARFLALEDGRRRLLALYKEEGFFYADVQGTLEFSPDFTHARARFEVREGEQVTVDRIVIRGNRRTSESLLRRRITLALGRPYRTSDVRKTEEQLATLNLFSSFHVALEDPQIPAKGKTVLVTVVERNRGTVDVRGGVTMGEGVFGDVDVAQGNLGGEAVRLGAHLRASYLPDFLIFDPAVRTNFDTLCLACADYTRERIAATLTTSVAFPDLRLGPYVSGVLDGVAAHTLEHDFVLTKLAAVPTIHIRPFHGLDIAISQTTELNDADIFQFATIAAYLETQSNSAELSALLRIPDGRSVGFAERVVVTWDRRDNSLNPHEGFLLVSGLENMDWGGRAESSTPDPYAPGGDIARPYGHTLRFDETVAVYLPLSKGVTLAGELRMGLNVQRAAGSATYPDRLFFMGGADSLRGYWQSSLVPQEDANRIATQASYTINDVAIRGGNVMLNPRAELRFPVLAPFDSVLFLDTGNLWAPPDAVTATTNDSLKDVFSNFSLRVTGGTGIRMMTPVAPAALDFGLNLSLLASPGNDPRRAYENIFAFNFAIGLF